MTFLPAVVLGAESDDLATLSLQELGSIQVTSVSKSPELLREAPAAIFVITQDDIQRSGATTLAEALRLAPNLRMTQMGANDHASSARGFGGNTDAQNFSNKLLLLIDGRSVYTPLFSGIYLDTQDLLLSDISRIEVISGPGATLWGANAMNGVINVITHPAYLTQGTSAAAWGGNQEQGLTARFGDSSGEASAYRIYGKARQHASMATTDGSSAEDNGHLGQAGFRMDFTLPRGAGTFQGDVYGGANDKPGPADESVSGANLLARWQSQTDRSDFQVQGYFDHVQRKEFDDPAAGVRFHVNTFDLEAQHSLWAGSRHKLIWGAGARLHRYQIDNAQNLLFLPPKRSLHVWNLFGQDTMALRPSLKLTVGLKLEHNSYSGWEPQPDVRLAWQASSTALVWVAASRAIRAPTPFDTEVLERVGGVDFLEGNADFKSEDVLASEIGFHTSISPNFSLSAAGFYNRYDDLRTIEFGSTPTFLPLRWDNLMEGHTFGVNAWATWQVSDWWRLSPGFALLQKRLHFKPGASELLGVAQAGNDPAGHALLTSSMDLGRKRTLDITVRHVGRLPDPSLAAYTELSARFAWRVSPAWELSIRGTNLLHDRHQEYPDPAGMQIRRSVMAEARWRP